MKRARASLRPLLAAGALFFGGCKGREGVSAQLQQCVGEAGLDRVLRSMGGEALGYSLCMAVAGGAETACESLPTQAASGQGSSSINPREQCRVSFRRQEFLRAVAEGRPREDVAAKMKAFVSLIPDNPDLRKLDFVDAASRILEVRRSRTLPKDALYPKQTFVYLLGKDACSAFSEPFARLHCVSDAKILEAWAGKDAKLCSDNDRAACSGMVEGAASCEPIKKSLISSYCGKKVGISKPEAVASSTAPAKPI